MTILILDDPVDALGFILPCDRNSRVPPLWVIDEAEERGDWRYTRYRRPNEETLRRGVINNDIIAFRRWVPCFPLVSNVTVRLAILVGELGRKEIYDLLTDRDVRQKNYRVANMFATKGACQVGNLEMVKYIDRKTGIYRRDLALKNARESGQRDIFAYLETTT